MAWTWLEMTPGSTMGSRRAKAVRSWQGMRQKASAEPERRAMAAEAAAVEDFMAAAAADAVVGGWVCVCVGCGEGISSRQRTAGAKKLSRKGLERV